MSEGNTFLKGLAEKLTEWDSELEQLKGKASQVAGDRKAQFEQIAQDVKTQAGQLKGKVDEYRGKSPDELKAEAEELMRGASGKIAEGLRSLSEFFENKAQGGNTSDGSTPPS